MDDFLGFAAVALAVAAIVGAIEFAIMYWYIIVAIVVICIVISRIKETNKKNKEEENKLKQDVEKTINIFFNENDRDYKKLNSYLDGCARNKHFSSLTISDEINKHYDQIVENIEHDFTYFDYEKLTCIEEFTRKYCAPIRHKYDNLFKVVLEIQEFDEPKNMILVNRETESIDIGITERFINQTFNMQDIGLQELLWNETLRKDFNLYSYRKIFGDIYNKVSNKKSLILFLSEEYIERIQKIKLKRRINYNEMIDSLDQEGKRIFDIGMKWIDSIK